MAYGNPVSFWYGTKAQYNSISTKLADTLYFITDEQTIYKGIVKFAEGIEQLLTVSTTAPTGAIEPYAKYFNSGSNKVCVYNGSSWVEEYTPAHNTMYYNQETYRFIRWDEITGDMVNLYDSGISVGENSGLALNDSTLTGVYATSDSIGMVMIGANIQVNSLNGRIYVNDANASQKGVVQIGENINVNNAVISVNNASTTQKGVVQLVNSVSDSEMQSETKAPTAHVVNTIYTELATNKQDKLTFDTTTGIEVVSGTTVRNDIATVEEVVKGTTGSNLVDADGLTGALSLGQAVDVSCPISAYLGTLSYVSFLDEIIFTCTSSSGYFHIGFDGISSSFPKFASGLKYLFICDVENINTNESSYNIAYTTGVPLVKDVTGANNTTLAYGEKIRVGFIFYSPTIAYFGGAASTSTKLKLTNCRQYEVTNLTDEAIQYLASATTNPNPDKLFRSQSFSDISGKYLVKSDMVNPWTYLIGMPTNSPAMTIGSGLAYQLSLTDGAEHEITVDTFPTDAYGQDSHIQLLLSNNSTAVFKSPLNLIDALTPNAAHNITVKFRAGQANVYVDDMDAGYVVTITSGIANGSLYYGIAGSTTGYIVFSNNMDNQTAIIPSGNTFNRSVYIVGNSTEKTSITCESIRSSGLSFTNLTLKDTAGYIDYTNITNCILDNDVIVGDIGLFVLLNNTISGTTVTNCGTTTAGPVVKSHSGTNYIKDCLFIGNKANYTGVVNVGVDTTAYISGTTFTGMAADYRHMLCIAGSWGTGCTFTVCSNTIFNAPGFINVGRYSDSKYATLVFDKTNKLDVYITSGGKVCFVKDSVLDLTGNTSSIPIFNANPLLTSVTGCTINVINSTASNAAIGGTATVLYNDNGVTKSRTISGGGGGYIMRNNGAWGVPVTVASGTGTGSLYDLLVNGTATDITFAPVVDGTITLSDNVTVTRSVNINGAGANITTLSTGYFGRSGTNYILSVADLTFSGYSYAGRQTYTNVKFANGTSRANSDYSNQTFYYIAGRAGTHLTIADCLFTETGTSDTNGRLIFCNSNSVVSIQNTIFTGNTCNAPLLQFGGTSTYPVTLNISGCTFSNNVGNVNGILYTGYVASTSSISDSVFDTDQNIVIPAGSLTFSGTNVLSSTISGLGTTTLTNGSILNLKTNTNENVISGGTVTVPAGATVTIIPYGATQASQYVTIEGGASGKTGTYIKNTGVNDLA